VNTRSNRGDGEILDVQGVFPREGAGVGAVVVVLPNAVRQFSELSWEQAVVEEPWQPQAEVATHLAGEARSVAALRWPWILEPSATELYVNRICTSLPSSLRIA